jgi:carbonic anhydrase
MERQNADMSESRRGFLRLAALCGLALPGAGAVATLFPARSAQAAGSVEALLLSCMDFRLMDEIERYMTERGLRDNYDHVVLAGASLGAVTDRYPAWNRTFWDHLGIAIELHHIRRVIVMDHRDCGAYKVIFGEDFAADAERETAVHRGKLHELAGLLKERHPALEVELLLMSLDGSVEAIPLPAQPD